MRLLLDTHVWLWGLIDPERLAPALAARLADPSTELWLSPISVWEALLLIERGRVEVSGDPARWVEHALVSMPVREAPLTRRVAIASRAVDLPHDDPADQFIAASAVVHELTLATADRRLQGSPGLRSLANE